MVLACSIKKPPVYLPKIHLVHSQNFIQLLFQVLEILVMVVGALFRAYVQGHPVYYVRI